MELIKDNKLLRLEGFMQLPVLRQLGFILGVAAAAALGIAAVLWSKEPTYGVLFGGLAQKDASVVMETLQKQNIPYKLDERTGALLVPATQVAELRLKLASEGLPRTNTGSGLEILQQKPEFGTSQFLETARYQHALEQELARSIMTIATVENARVHLALPKQSSFIRKKEEPSASVLLSLISGRTLEKEQVSAITHMVASSIPNLSPGKVTIVDQMGNLLTGRNQTPEMAFSQEQFEYTAKVEDGYIARIENILSPVLGREGMRAQVKAELDFTVSEQTQESYNPDLPALRSQQLYEEQSSGPGNEGVPGALSNQPPSGGQAPELAQPGANGAPAGANGKSLKRATNNYELDRTISHKRLATGSVKRLSVAVVVDDKAVPGADGQLTREPRSPEDLERITALVREAVGYDAARGDSVNVVNASFTLAKAEPLPEPPLWKQTWALDLGKQLIAGLVVLLLVLFVVVPTLKLAFGKAEPEKGEGAEGEEGAAGAAVVGAVGPDGTPLALAGPGSIAALPRPTDSYEDNLAIAREMARSDPKTVAQVLRTWLNTDEEK